MKIIDFHCTVCKRYLGSVEGEENVEEAKKMYSIYDEGVCWKCKKEDSKMSEYLGSKTIKKTRKDHSCFGCNTVIPKGSGAETTTFRSDDNEIRTVYECNECKQYELTECIKCELRECEDAWDGTVDEGYKGACEADRSGLYDD